MTEADFRRMKKAVEKNGWFLVYDPKGDYTEVLKNGPSDYSVYSVYPGDAHHVTERYCITTSNSLDRLKYLFVD